MNAEIKCFTSILETEQILTSLVVVMDKMYIEINKTDKIQQKLEMSCDSRSLLFP